MTTAGPQTHQRSAGRPISRSSEDPVRPRRTGSLLTARWVPVLLSFCLSGLALGWLLLGARAAPQVSTRSNPPSDLDNRSHASASTSALIDQLPQRQVAPVFSTTVMYWAADIERWSVEYGLNPNLVATVMQIESCGHPAITSPSGAIGLFQVMPYHFTGRERPQDPDTNAARGLAYLARSQTLAEKRLPQTLAGYNGGHGVILLPRQSWPQQTRRYVRWGMGILKEIAAGETKSGTLQRWMDEGGDRLCQSAMRALALRP